VDGSDAPFVELPQHVMNKLNLKMGTEPTFEILCTLNIPQEIDEVQFDYDVTNKMSQTFEDSPHRSVASDLLSFLPTIISILYGSLDRKVSNLYYLPTVLRFQFLASSSLGF
jgi:hypothetical protein